MSRTVRLVLLVDCEVDDPTWTDAELVENAVTYFDIMIRRGEERNARADSPYRLSTDAALWTWDGFLADLREGTIEEQVSA